MHRKVVACPHTEIHCLTDYYNLMVCALGTGRMAVMARFLAAGSIPQTISGFPPFIFLTFPGLAEDVGRHKLAAQYICTELKEADEANLIDEEDMHVFGLRPMTDPLHLVCCNSCKKPIKVSQYVAHAEICKSLNSVDEIIPELDGGTRQKKPPRKQRRKSLNTYSNQAVAVRENEKPQSFGDAYFSALDSNMEEKVPSTILAEAKRSSPHLDGAVLTDGSAVSTATIDCIKGAKSRQTKRSKMPATGSPQLLDNFEAASVVTYGLCSTTALETIPCEEARSSTKNEQICNCVVGVQMPAKAHAITDVPHPVATKIYYSLRNQRLRSALNHLYFGASSMDSSSDCVSPKALQKTELPSQKLCPTNFHEGLPDIQLEKASS
ncbi:PREDICTED: uncharacterized protein LOC109168191 isoform X3 [Ipomoea nil]|uniref:uncharacterized protein LOC109168191 isoform X3 n=1 Tax=Ipomoea nil TaxID=35883 RepID=UPI000901FAE0|nr:PREDICTED: uncharacterized protein LOC109168191 isoform X3 [Ipomoea nil]XP_019172780.1 PREDICTED: uncharacterized protein LOC109168191 isoform X3 [Ipomoea nil]